MIGILRLGFWPERFPFSSVDLRKSWISWWIPNFSVLQKASKALGHGWENIQIFMESIEMNIFVRIESKESFDKWQMSKSCFKENIYNYAQSLTPFVKE